MNFQVEKCRFTRQDVGAKVFNFVRIPEGDEELLKEAVATIGPISAAVDYQQQSFFLYEQGTTFVYN